MTCFFTIRQWPYHMESTASRPISKVRGYKTMGLSSTWMGDCLGTPDAIDFFIIYEKKTCSFYMNSTTLFTLHVNTFTRTLL